MGLGTCAITSGLHAAVLAHQIAVIRQPRPEVEVLELSNWLVWYAAAVEMLALHGTIVLWAMWVYRAAKNLRAMEPDGVFELTPGAQVWWYFVPFVNVVKPYQGTKEVLECTFAALDRASPPHALLGGWWALWLTRNFLALLQGGLVPNPETTSGDTYLSWLIAASGVAIVGELLAIGAAITAIRLVGSINREQIAWSAQAQASGAGA